MRSRKLLVRFLALLGLIVFGIIFIPHQRKLRGFSPEMNWGNVFSVRDENYTLKKPRSKDRGVFIKALKKSSFDLFKVFKTSFLPKSALAACQGNYWCGVWMRYLSCPDGSACTHEEERCFPTGTCAYGDQSCEDAGPKTCSVFGEFYCNNNCPCEPGECCVGSGCNVPGDVPLPSTAPPPPAGCAGICCADSTCETPLGGAGDTACAAANPAAPRCCTSCSTSSDDVSCSPPSGRSLVYFYHDKDRSREITDATEAVLPFDPSQINMTITVPTVETETRSPSYNGVPVCGTADGNRTWQYSRTCGVPCPGNCQGLTPTGGCGINCPADPVNPKCGCESTMSTFLRGVEKTLFAGFSDGARLKNCSGSDCCYGTFSKNVNYSVTLPGGYEITSIRSSSNQEVYFSGTSFTLQLTCTSCAGTLDAWQTRPIKIGIVRANVNPEVLSFSSSAGQTCKGTGQEITFNTRFGDIDEPANNLVQNGSFENGTTDWILQGGGTKQTVTDTVFGTYAFYIIGGTGATASGRVIQWLTIGNNTAYTLSLSSKGTVSVNAHEWCLGVEVADNQFVKGYAFPLTTAYTSKRWQFTSGTCAADQTHSVAIFIDVNNPSQYATVDGVLLEQGTTQGIFTDINIMQLNLEAETDANYSNELWPIRAMFARRRTGYNNDIFQVTSGGTEPWLTGNVLFDSVTQRWYLASNITLAGQAVLLGGASPIKTYFTLNNQTINIVFTIRFEANFPLRTYNATIYTRDLWNLEDEAPERTPSNLLQINGGPVPDNLWDFHRMGNFTVNSCTGTITGNIRQNTDCTTCPATIVPTDSTWAVTCTGDGIDGSIGEPPPLPFAPARQPTNGSYICQTEDRTSTVLPFGDYTITFTPSTAPVKIQNCTPPVSYTLNLNSSSATANFYQCPPQDPWWQTVSGNIHSDGQVIDAVPNNQWLMTGIPAILSYGSFGTGLQDSIRSIDPLYAQSGYDADIYNYLWWDRHLQDEEKIEAPNFLTEIADDGVYTVDSSNQITGAADNGVKIVILHDGDLTLTGDIEVDPGSFLMVVSSGKITISPSVTSIQGIFIADEIEFATVGGIPYDSLLEAQGTFIGWNGISILRDIGPIQSVTNPSVVFTYRPDLVVNAPEFIQRIFYTWEQKPG
ncbi:MAG TPA: carbohydrate binding domain-containing protein [Candidatus Bathyarchaeia archaeon]|nr:carbohydrate binding domain-containing protein [Candidatus Bathyarchaeia archaeon]